MRQRRFRDLKTDDFVMADDGRVMVRRCYPIRWINDRPTPFPTLYWLADEDLVKRISHIERQGWIKRFEARIADDPELTNAFRADHRSYIEERWAMLTDEDQKHAEGLGLRERGIGGLLDFGKVKCLHLHYAHHLARSNTVGRLMEEQELL